MKRLPPANLNSTGQGNNAPLAQRQSRGLLILGSGFRNSDGVRGKGNRVVKSGLLEPMKRGNGTVPRGDLGAILDMRVMYRVYFSPTLRMLHNGSASDFQSDGPGSIPGIRSVRTCI